jgi:hypothetical protein
VCVERDLCLCEQQNTFNSPVKTSLTPHLERTLCHAIDSDDAVPPRGGGSLCHGDLDHCACLESKLSDGGAVLADDDAAQLLGHQELDQQAL